MNQTQTTTQDDVRRIEAMRDGAAFDAWRENGGRVNEIEAEIVCGGGYRQQVWEITTDEYAEAGGLPRGAWLLDTGHPGWHDGDLVLVRLKQSAGEGELKLRHAWIDGTGHGVVLIPPGVAFSGGDPTEPGDVFDLDDDDRLERIDPTDPEGLCIHRIDSMLTRGSGAGMRQDYVSWFAAVVRGTG